MFSHTSSTAQSSSEDLQAHLLRSHNLLMCPLCLVHRKIFIGEQHLYTPGQLQRHLTSRDQQGPQHGHPICNMCNQRFYDQVCQGVRSVHVCLCMSRVCAVHVPVHACARVYVCTDMCMCICMRMCVRT